MLEASEEIKKWFEEGSKVLLLRREGYNCVIVKGFKINHYLKSGKYTIRDTRFSDFSKSVSETNMDIFRKEGFLRGTSIIMHERNIKRVSYYLERIRKLMVRRQEYKKLLKEEEDKAFCMKRIKNANENIHVANDLMHFYKAKVDQFNSKELERTTIKN